MRCPITPELWQHYQDTGDQQIADHLASCPTCRAEAGRFAHLQSSLASLNRCQLPEDLWQRTQVFGVQVADKEFTCRETLELLEVWRAGELDAVQSFLIEDHLLACPSCALADAQADLLTESLRSLPVFDVPAVVAERIARARTPWWQRLLPASGFAQQLRVAGSLAAGLIMALGCTLFMQRAAQTPFAKLPATLPVHVERPIASVPNTPAMGELHDNIVASVVEHSIVHNTQPKMSVVGTVAHAPHNKKIHINQTPSSGLPINVNKDVTTKIGTPTPETVAGAQVPETAPTTVQETVTVAAADQPVEYSAERDMVASALNERMTEIDDLTAAASENVRRVDTRPRWASVSSGLQ